MTNFSLCVIEGKSTLHYLKMEAIHTNGFGQIKCSFFKQRERLHQLPLSSNKGKDCINCHYLQIVDKINRCAIYT